MEYHNIPPLYNTDSRILILGSFPSVKSREGQFFYHHPQNRYWRVMAAVFDCDVPQTIEDKKVMILSHKTAMWDVLSSCEITGSSDSSIKNPIPNDIESILNKTQIKHIYTNGGTAHKYYQKYIASAVGIEDIMLPSTSPANAAWSYERLVEVWKENIDKGLEEAFGLSKKEE